MSSGKILKYLLLLIVLYGFIGPALDPMLRGRKAGRMVQNGNSLKEIERNLSLHSVDPIPYTELNEVLKREVTCYEGAMYSLYTFEGYQPYRLVLILNNKGIVIECFVLNAGKVVKHTKNDHIRD